ncbi:DNA polymerase I [Liberibacter crescens BT-1]|uniref:DNA polymerase I n=1 Tax=Liberibacter crescens (strain BT-1) TaxID=1215343 RepID=L0EVN9_LIBCB|nr:DNA polymerase I [Liberibacter crescens]AGA64925.1 DNA polymerase I [Liberibacter crescens BT-1]AMC12950.1 DNA polymerase I [Liberibacter crescens]
MQKGDHLFLIDASGFIFRAFYAMPPLHRKADGLPVNAVSGFCNMIWKLLKDARNTEISITPSHFAIIFDHPAKTFRNVLYEGYKTNRSAAPEELIIQFPLIRLATQAFSLPSIEIEGFEADDIIASYTRAAEKEGAEITIVSSDKDLMQLVSPSVSLYDTLKNKRIGIDDVLKKWGVPPEKMICLQALTGDSIDNIPGIPGIGPKTAALLLEEYGNLDNILLQAHTMKPSKRRDALIEHANMARLSRELVTLRTDLPLPIPLNEILLHPQEGSQLIAFLKAMELNALIKHVAKVCDCDASLIEAADVDPGETWRKKNDEHNSPNTEVSSISDRKIFTPQSLVIERSKSFKQLKTEDTFSCQQIIDINNFKTWIHRIRDNGIVGFKVITDKMDILNSKLVGFSFAMKEKTIPLSQIQISAIYIPLNTHNTPEIIEDESASKLYIPNELALSYLKELLEDPSILKIGHNIKYDIIVMKRYGIDICSFDDTMLMSYVLDSGRSDHNLKTLSKKWLDHIPINYKDLTGTGKLLTTFDKLPISQVKEYAAECCDINLKLWMLLKQRLVAEGLLSVYERLERPMVTVLGEMETNGIYVNQEILLQLSHELLQESMILEKKIHALAGENFNIASPKQLSNILFTKIGLSSGFKTKTGQKSTSAQALEKMKFDENILLPMILEWRQLSKLRSTYTDALPHYINKNTHRIHTHYSLAATTTGRLSSSEPNLQNIPVRNALGRKIRKAFIAPHGKKLISADYSQIELRVLAHIAHVSELCQAFADGIDIHAMIASEVFNIPLKEMSIDVRRRAKAINFGIIYGISSFMLANQLAISRSEASEYIELYFKRFPGIRDYIETTKAFVHQHGYVETIFGRRIYYPEINARKASIRQFNERAAINAPIQGSAADIIRRAMIRMKKDFIHHNISAQMLLQVHDELVFEVKEEEVIKSIPIISKAMENAPFPKLNLIVPLKVDIRAGYNWEEAH